jgi:hypothetical protein
MPIFEPAGAFISRELEDDKVGGVGSCSTCEFDSTCWGEQLIPSTTTAGNDSTGGVKQVSSILTDLAGSTAMVFWVCSSTSSLCDSIQGC